MPRRSLRCEVELNIRAVTCPGVWLPRRDDVYISVQMFGQCRRTQLATPIFPLICHERFRFDKIFYTAFEPSHVATELEDQYVIVELIQDSPIYAGGRLLASYQGRARDFLYPYPTYSSQYLSEDRELLMDRNLDFPGISPKLEFSTRTVLRESALGPYDQDLTYSARTARSTSRIGSATARPRSRSRSRSRQSYKNHTISSIHRSRSASPSASLSRSFQALDLTEYKPKPPFVVRKVDTDLIGRSPAGYERHAASKKKSTQSTYSYDDLCVDTYRPYSRITKVVRTTEEDPYPVYGRYTTVTTEEQEPEDLEVATYTSAYDPVPRSSLQDRYDLRRWSLAQSDIISRRVEQALARNRWRDPYYSRSRYLDMTNAELNDSLDRLERDFHLAKTRRYYP